MTHDLWRDVGFGVSCPFIGVLVLNVGRVIGKA